MRASRLLTLLNQHDRALAMANAALQRVKPTDIRRKMDIQGLQEATMIAKLRHEENLRAQICHIAKLPFELLALVFQEAVQVMGTHPFHLAHVCGHWRRVATDMPALWSTLTIRNVPKVQKTLRLLQLAQHRLSSLHLIQPRDLQKLGAALPASTKELDYLECDIGSSVNVFQLYQIHPGARRLLLRGPIPLDPPLNIRPFVSERVEELWVEDLCVNWRILAHNLPQLAHLTIANTSLPSFRGLLGLLSTTPYLRALILQRLLVAVRDEGDWDTPVDLAHLIEFEIDVDSTPPFDLAQYISFPNLRKLRLINTYGRYFLETLATKHTLALTELRIRNPITIQQCSPIRPFLRESLETLELSKTAIPVAEIVEDLAQGLCPRLTSLTLSNSLINEDTIIRLVKARNGGDEQSLKMLIVDSCDNVNPDVLPWLRSKVPVVSCVYMTKKQAKKKNR
jgi:F-box/TPR repeat protein Pof3